MIRFVDIRGNGTGHRFAFWNTVSNKFCEFFSEQAWDDIDDFTEAFNLAGGEFSDGVRKSGIERFTELCPDWVAVKMSDDEDV